MTAGSTHYNLPFAVDVPDKTATMVLLLSKSVPGESIFLFSPDPGVPQSASHPFRVVRFTNDTPGLLERGPIAVYENGAFLGQGMVEPLPPGGIATVPSPSNVPSASRASARTTKRALASPRSRADALRSTATG